MPDRSKSSHGSHSVLDEFAEFDDQQDYSSSGGEDNDAPLIESTDRRSVSLMERSPSPPRTHTLYPKDDVKKSFNRKDNRSSDFQEDFDSKQESGEFNSRFSNSRGSSRRGNPSPSYKNRPDRFQGRKFQQQQHHQQQHQQHPSDYDPMKVLAESKSRTESSNHSSQHQRGQQHHHQQGHSRFQRSNDYYKGTDNNGPPRRDRYGSRRDSYSDRDGFSGRKHTPRSLLEIKKTSQLGERKIKIIGRSSFAPSFVEEPVEVKQTRIKDWYQFTLENTEEYFQHVMDAASREASRNHPGPNRGYQDERRMNDNQPVRHSPTTQKHQQQQQQHHHRGNGDRFNDNRISKGSDEISPSFEGGNHNTKRQTAAPKIEKLEYFLIYADDDKFRKCFRERRWFLPRGPIEAALNSAYNHADLVLIFFSHQILGCARITSAFGLNGNSPLPSCSIDDMNSGMLSFQDVKMNMNDAVDGKQLSEQVGSNICQRLRENRNHPSPMERRGNDSRGSSRGNRNHHQQQRQFQQSNSNWNDNRRYSNGPPPTPHSTDRRRNFRPPNYWRDNRVPTNMRSVDSGIFRGGPY